MMDRRELLQSSAALGIVAAGSLALPGNGRKKGCARSWFAAAEKPLTPPARGSILVAFLIGVRFVEAGNLASSGGLSSAIDLARRVVERYYGARWSSAISLSGSPDQGLGGQRGKGIRGLVQALDLQERRAVGSAWMLEKLSPVMKSLDHPVIPGKHQGQRGTHIYILVPEWEETDRECHSRQSFSSLRLAREMSLG
jgi:hypothetical protein